MNTVIHYLAMFWIIVLFVPMLLLTFLYVILDIIGNWWVDLLEEHIG